MRRKKDSLELVVAKKLLIVGLAGHSKSHGVSMSEAWGWHNLDAAQKAGWLAIARYVLRHGYK